MEVRKRRSRAESLSTSAWSVQGCWANLRQVVQKPESRIGETLQIWVKPSSAADTSSSQDKTESTEDSLLLLTRLHFLGYLMSFHEKKAKKKILTSNLHVLLAPRSRYLQNLPQIHQFF